MQDDVKAKCKQQWTVCERFELRSHFVSRLSLIVQVNVVLNSTVVVDGDSHFDNLCSSHLQSQSEWEQPASGELYHVRLKGSCNHIG